MALSNMTSQKEKRNPLNEGGINRDTEDGTDGRDVKEAEARGQVGLWQGCGWCCPGPLVNRGSSSCGKMSVHFGHVEFEVIVG